MNRVIDRLPQNRGVGKMPPKFQGRNQMDPVHHLTQQVSKMEIVPEQPSVFSLVSDKIKEAQGVIDASRGDAQKINHELWATCEYARERHAALLEYNPSSIPFVTYMLYVTFLDAADMLVPTDLLMNVNIFAEKEQLGNLCEALRMLTHAEQHYHLPLANGLETVTPERTYYFNFIWKELLKSACLIEINGPAPMPGFLCSCCTGNLMLQSVAEYIKMVDENPLFEEIRGNILLVYDVLVKKAGVRSHGGTCPAIVQSFAHHVLIKSG